MADDLPVMSFADGEALRDWLALSYRSSRGLWVRLFRSRSGVPSGTFEDLLDLGLCYGWSESKRIRGDGTSYLQRFTPRRRTGTTSERNRRLAERLLLEGRMTNTGSRRWGWIGRRSEASTRREVDAAPARLARTKAATLCQALPQQAEVGDRAAAQRAGDAPGHLVGARLKGSFD